MYFDKHFDGVFNFYYLPPNKETENFAVAKAGNIAHISFDFFEAYEQHFLGAHREIFKILIKEMLPDPWIKADEMPIYSRINVTESKEYMNLGVKVTYPEAKRFRGVLDEQLVLKGGRKVLVKGEYKSATDVKTGAKLTFSKNGEYTEIVMPEIEGFTLIVLEK